MIYFINDRAECPDDVRYVGLEKFPKKILVSVVVSSKKVSMTIFRPTKSLAINSMINEFLKHVLLPFINEHHSDWKYILSKSQLLERDASLAEWKGHIRTQAILSTIRLASKTNRDFLGFFGIKNIRRRRISLKLIELDFTLIEGEFQSQLYRSI